MIYAIITVSLSLIRQIKVGKQLTCVNEKEFNVSHFFESIRRPLENDVTLRYISI